MFTRRDLSAGFHVYMNLLSGKMYKNIQGNGYINLTLYYFVFGPTYFMATYYKSLATMHMKEFENLTVVC